MLKTRELTLLRKERLFVIGGRWRPFHCLEKKSASKCQKKSGVIIPDVLQVGT